jgi:diguanylate cyclase (GGDEF)-like protein/PAS domain S-box-containing protein
MNSNNAASGEAETRLQEADADRAFLSAVLDTVDALVLVLDRAGHIVRFNRACEQLSGYASAEVLGRPVWDLLIPESELEGVREVFRHLHAGQFPSRHENYWRTRGGERRLIAWSNTALLDAEGAVEFVVATGIDITELHRSRQRADMYKRIVFAATEHLSFVGRDYVYRAVNKAYQEAHGRRDEAIVGHHVAELFGETTFESIKPYLDRCLAGETVTYQRWFDFEGVGRRLMDVAYSPARDEGGGIIGLIVNSRDITDEAKAETDRRLATKVFDHAGDAILITDDDAVIVDVNPAFCRITGYAREEVIGANAGIAKSGYHGADFYQDMWSSLREGGYWEGEVWDRRKGGEVYPKWLTVNAVTDSAGQTTHYVGIFSDITEEKAQEEQLRRLAHHDSLTGLPNRALFFDRLTQAIAHARRERCYVAVMFLDLDHFKAVNDRFGHDIGDRLLCGIAGRLSACVRHSDTVARLAGDEFTVILPDLTDPEAAGRIADKMLAGLTEPFDLSGQRITVTASIGIAIHPRDAADAEALLARADQAAYAAKRQGRNARLYYDLAPPGG